VLDVQAGFAIVPWIMRIALLCLPLVLVGGCGMGSEAAFPTPFIPQHPVAGDYPGVGAAVLDEIASLDFRIVQPNPQTAARLAAVLDHWRRIKIISKEGLTAAQITLDEDGYSSVANIRARSVSQDGTISSLDPDTIRVINPPSGSRLTPAIRQLRFAVPDASIGGIVEYRYERAFADADMFPTWVFGGALPTLRSEFAIIARPDMHIDFRKGRGETVLDEVPLRRALEDGRERLVFVEKQLPAYFQESGMAHLARIAPWVAVVVTSVKKPGIRVMQTWADVGRKLEKLFEPVGGTPESGSPESCYKKIRDEIVPIDALGLGVMPPVSAGEHERGMPACTRDAAAWLYQVLTARGVKAYPALLSSKAGPPVVEGMPGFYPFIRAVVAVDVKQEIAKDPTCSQDPVSRGLLCTVPSDSYAFLDPLCHGCRFGELPNELTDGRALVIAGESPRLVEVPADPPERNRMMSQFRLALEVDGKVTGAMSGELTGTLARSLRKQIDGVEPGPARDTALSKFLLGPKSVFNFDNPAFTAARDVDQPLGVKAQVKGVCEEVAYERYLLRPREFVGPAFGEVFSSVRKYAKVLESPSWIESVATVSLPSGYEAEARPVVKIIQPFAEYAYGYSRKGRTLTFSRRLVIKRHVITVEEWPRFFDFVEKVQASEAEGLAVWRQGD